jgi:hypothetical protein
MKLVSETTGKLMVVGDKYATFRGESVELIGMAQPRHAASTGRVRVMFDDYSEGEYFPGVIGAKWIEFNERETILLEHVRAYAQAHYHEARKGWDYVVEAWSDYEIVEEVAKCRTAKGAVEKMRKAIKPLADLRSEVRAEIF